MPNIEQIIRHALEKIDTKNGDLREQVYRAVWEHHERTIVGNPQLSDENRSEQRNMLISLIQTIEEEYTQLNNQTPSVAENNAIDAAFNAETFGEIPQKIDNNINHDENRPVDDIEDHILQEIGETSNHDKLRSVGPEELGIAPTGGQETKLQKRHSWWRSNLILMILLILLVLVAWAFYNSLTAINRPEGATPQISNPPATITDQERVSQNDGWITVFDPERINDFSVQGGAEAQIKSDGNNRALRFKGNSLDDKVIIDVGSGVIEQLRGKTVTFNVIARSANNTNAQIAITCDFGLDDSCGKRNFDLRQTREDLLFSVEIPKNISERGQLFLQSALLGPEYEIDIFAVRVRIED